MGVGDPLREEELQVAHRITLERGLFGYAIHSLYFGSYYHGNKPFLCMLRHMEDLGAHYLLNEDENDEYPRFLFSHIHTTGF